MNLKRFFGKNSREALNQVRKALGENAVIISNRALDGGNEIIAVKEEDMHALAIDGNLNDMSKTRRSEIDAIPTISRPITKQSQGIIEPMTLLEMLNKNNQIKTYTETINQDKNTQSFQSGEDEKEDHPTLFEDDLNIPTFINPHVKPNQEMNTILHEMRAMRTAIESQLTTISWTGIQQHNPVKSQILSTLLSAGFSAALSRKLAEKLPDNLDFGKSIAWLKTVLAKNMHAVEDESEMLKLGGVFALIGPTGVGKTTTVAKLAARYVMQYGTQNLGLITTDAYRIGGHEQLRIYGKILGVMVHSVKDETDLEIALNELKGKHTVLIDTVGMSQRDQMVNEQIAMLSNTQTPIKRLLCLNATSTGETLANVVKAYKGNGLEGCIMTKTDEAATTGNVLDAIIRERLKLYYVTNGQRVPEDILVANKQNLIQEALNHECSQYLPYKYLADELPFVMANTVGNSHGYAEVQYA